MTTHQNLASQIDLVQLKSSMQESKVNPIQSFFSKKIIET